MATGMHLCGTLDRRVGRSPGCARVALVRQHLGQYVQAGNRPVRIGIGVGLCDQVAELCGGSYQVALDRLCPSEVATALTRDEAVADRVGEVASFFAGRARCDRITRMKRRPCLPAEDLAQPPAVTCCACQPERLGEVWPGHLWVVAVYTAAGGERPDQQGGVAEFAGDRQGLFGLIGAVGWRRPTRRATPHRRVPAHAPPAPPRPGVRSGR